MRLTEGIEKRIKNVKIVIDSESNERVFSNILQAFQKSTAKDSAPTIQPSIWRMIFRNPITKLAAAAVIIVTISLFISHQVPSEQGGTDTVSKVPKSPVEMLTVASLIIAFRHGGIEAIEKQCDKALEMQKRPLDKLDIKELFTEIEIDLERTEL